MRLNILGALEMVHDGAVCTPTAPKVRWVLALLAVRANHIVGMHSLIEELWGENPPRSAVTTTQTYIYQIRKIFEQYGIGDTEPVLRTCPPGYLLRLDDDEMDATVFAKLIARGANLLEQDRSQEASNELGRALALWRGPALASIPVGQVLEAHVAHLAELRTRALEMRIQADLRLGRFRELIPHLRAMVSEDPLNEWMHGQLIESLYRAGRRSEALRAYQRLREILDTELGLEPSPTMQRLQHEMLTGGRPPKIPASRSAPLVSPQMRTAG